MTTATPKADRFYRAPKGGAVSPINGLYYKGGQFMPMATAGFKAGPVALEGSSRQVAWATRLQAEALAKLDAAIADANALLSVATRAEAPVVRSAVRTLAITRHAVKATRSASTIIGWRQAASA